MLVDFYLLAVNDQASLLRHACNLLIAGYQKQGRYYVHANDEAAAYELDELLWTHDAESFVPHQLLGEHAVRQAPIVIGFAKNSARSTTANTTTTEQTAIPNLDLPVLLNLATTVPNFNNQFRHIIDLTSCDEESLEHGRARFRHYKTCGMTINYHDCRKSEHAHG